MKKKRPTEEQIIAAIKQHESEVKVDDIRHKLSISSDTRYNWRSKYASPGINEAKQLRELEAENNELKRGSKPKDRGLIHSDQGVRYMCSDWGKFVADHNLEACQTVDQE